MGRIGVAFRAFFGALGSGAVAERLDQALSGQTTLTSAVTPVAKPDASESGVSSVAKPAPAPAPKPLGRSDALTLLATLQREARLVDFLQEPIADYSDDQIGAAVRDIHRDCGKVLERLFALRPVAGDAEGATVTVPGESETHRLTGQVTGTAPFTGTLVHPGWRATRCDLPVWTGDPRAKEIVAPAEVEVR
jgi:hypothetical protein